MAYREDIIDWLDVINASDRVVRIHRVEVVLHQLVGLNFGVVINGYKIMVNRARFSFNIY